MPAASRDGLPTVSKASRLTSLICGHGPRQAVIDAAATRQMRQICEYAFMRTTVDLPDALFKRVKSEAALRGMRLKEFIAQSLEKSLAGQRDDLKSRRVRLPLVWGSGEHPINLTREQVDTGIWE
jgi:hypothetical protein